MTRRDPPQSGRNRAAPVILLILVFLFATVPAQGAEGGAAYEKPEAWLPIASLSITTLLIPWRARKYAVAAPTSPAPTIATSAVSPLILPFRGARGVLFEAAP